MKFFSTSNSIVVAASVIFITLFTGCEVDPNPFLGQDQPFTVYGFLNPKAERQIVRVIPVASSIEQVGVGSDQATVRTTHLGTGETRVWKDSLVTFSNESTGVVFFSDFKPDHEASYRLEVIRDDGAASRVEVTVPRDIKITRQESANPLIPVFLLEGEILPNLVQVDMQYETLALQPQSPVRLEPVAFPVAVSYLGEERPVAGGWEYRLDYRDDLQFIREEFGAHCLTTDYITVRSIHLEFFVADDSWVPPGGEFDPEVLVQPEVFSNVENGFGYFGAGYPVSFNLIPPSTVLTQVGFTFSAPCGDLTPHTPETCRVHPGCFDE